MNLLIKATVVPRFSDEPVRLECEQRRPRKIKVWLKNDHARSKSRTGKRLQTKLCAVVLIYQVCIVGKMQVVITGPM